MPTTTTKENPRLQHYTITMGCDPEFFFSKKGEIIGSEKIIPKDICIWAFLPCSFIIIYKKETALLNFPPSIPISTKQLFLI